MNGSPLFRKQQHANRPHDAQHPTQTSQLPELNLPNNADGHEEEHQLDGVVQVDDRVLHTSPGTNTRLHAREDAHVYLLLRTACLWRPAVQLPAASR